jgi:hypothetical protein
MAAGLLGLLGGGLLGGLGGYFGNQATQDYMDDLKKQRSWKDQQYRGAMKRSISLMDKTSDQALADIGDWEKRENAGVLSNATQRGLTGTTIVPSLQMGVGARATGLRNS